MVDGNNPGGDAMVEPSEHGHGYSGGRADGRSGTAGLTVPLESRSSLAPAVTHAAALLELLAAEPRTPARLSDLSRRLRLPKSSVANICAALVATGLLRRTDAGFALGWKLAQLGAAYLSTVDRVQEFYDACFRLEIASGETIQLGMLDDREVVYLGRHDGRQPVRLVSEIGQRLPASCTAMGKAALASLDPDDLAERYRGLRSLPVLTRNSHRTFRSLLADLGGIRERGYSVDDEETAEGVLCLGVAITGPQTTDKPYAASLTLLRVRATDDRRAALIADLRRLAMMLAGPLSESAGASRR